MQNLGQNIVSDMGENIFLYQLAFLRSTESLLKRIPSGLGGVYAWYRHFNITQALSDDSSLFFKFMLSELSKDHCVSRSSKILPAYKISLCSDNGSFPKLKLLEKLSEEKEFRDSILEILNRSLLFQQPFYIGKTNNFKSRIKSHLNLDSPLRVRLYEAGHDLGKAKLLLIGDKEYTQIKTFPNDDDISSEFDSEQLQDKELELIEDILSRLFLPSFTIRYG